jgi:hypothetical protein
MPIPLNVNRLVFLMDRKYVFCEVGTEVLQKLVERCLEKDRIIFSITKLSLLTTLVLKANKIWICYSKIDSDVRLLYTIYIVRWRKGNQKIIVPL